jgi:hypothetical protein
VPEGIDETDARSEPYGESVFAGNHLSAEHES